jgi:hypothetical protein
MYQQKSISMEKKRNIWTAPKLVRLDFAATAAYSGSSPVDSVYNNGGSNNPNNQASLS